MTRGTSTESTGALGPSYERAVAATYLAAMLVNGLDPGLKGKVVRVAAQQPAALDDLSIQTEDDTGRTAVARLQIKHQLALTSSQSNTDFASIVADAWRDLQAPGFVDGVDRVGAVAERITTDSVYAAERLGEMAVLAADGDALLGMLIRPGQGGHAKTLWDVVSTLSADSLGFQPTSDELHRFWRHFIVVRVEATFERNRDRSHAIDRLRAVTFHPGAPSPRDLFGTLELIAGTLNVRGAGFDANQLRTHLAERYDTTLEPADPKLEPIARTARTAAERDLQAWRDDLKIAALPPEFLPLDPTGHEDGKPSRPIAGAAFTLNAIEEYLRRHRVLAIQGVPGAGKSHSLVQIAQHIFETSELIPIVRRLPHLAHGGQAILDGVATAPFHTIGRDNLAMLARVGRLVLLLDGWNELGATGRSWAWEALGELRRLYPSILLVITTRSGTVRPAQAEMRLDLLEFDRDRQIAAAELQHGSEGRPLLVRARAQTNLRPLLRIPLFLTAILAQAKLGTLPTDRESAIRQLVEVARGAQELRETIRVALDGQQWALLEDLGWALMERETAIEEFELLPILTASLELLRGEQKLFADVKAPQALEHLLSDAILAASGDPGSREIQFSHQLLQEWFASHRLDRMIRGADQAVPLSLLQIVDDPVRSTALLFSVERLARDAANAAALRALVAATLGIEPFLAAEMLSRMPEVAKAPLDGILDVFSRGWEAEQPTRTAAFMLASRRPQFGARLWQTLKDTGELAFGLRGSRQGFPLDALLPDWDANFLTLNAQTRRGLLIDVIDQGDPAGLDLVVSAALEETDYQVVSGVVDYLDFHDEGRHLNRLLAGLDDGMGERIARERRPDAIDETNCARWQAWRRKRFDAAEGVEWIQLALEYDAASSDQVVERLLALKSDNNGWSTRGLFERVAARHGETLARTLVDRLSKGEEIPFEARPYLAPAPVVSGDLIAIIADEEADWHIRADVARLLDEAAIGWILDDLLAASGDPEFRRDKRHRQLSEALEYAQFSALASAVLAREAGNADQIYVLADALADWRSGDDGPLLPLTQDARAALEAKVPGWVAAMIADAGGQRYRLAALGRLIGRMGTDALLPGLIQLIEEDRARHRRQREERDLAPGRYRDNEASMVYDNQYRDALQCIGGEGVVAAMVTRFPNPAWEVDAAIVLGQLRAVEPRRTAAFGREAVELYDRRSSLAERAGRPPDAIAAMILDRIDQLVRAGDKASITTALDLAGSAIQMDYGDRSASLRALLDGAQETYRFPEFAKALAERGELLPAKIVFDNIRKEAEALAAKSWYHENELWKVRLWLRLAAFADDPSAALSDPATWPKEVRPQHSHRELLFALGYSRAPGAPRALEMLRQADPTRLFGETWPRALAEIGTEDAATVLLDAIETTPVDPKHWRDTHGMRTALEKLIAHPNQRDRAFRMLGTIAEPAKLGLIARAIVETMTEADAIGLLHLADRPERAVIGRELVARLENAAVTRIPIEGAANTYEIEGAPLVALRERAFELQRTGAPNEDWARQVLQAIDELRDQYGKPLSEPNHPDLSAAKPWPRAAQEAWDVTSIDWKS